MNASKIRHQYLFTCEAIFIPRAFTLHQPSVYFVEMADATENGTGLANSPAAAEDEEVNNSIKQEPEPSSSETQGRGDSMNLDGSADQLPASLQADNAVPADEVEARIPQKKDATLKEFLGKMDDYAPIVGLGNMPLSQVIGTAA